MRPSEIGLRAQLAGRRADEGAAAGFEHGALQATAELVVQFVVITVGRIDACLAERSREPNGAVVISHAAHAALAWRVVDALPDIRRSI
eukprot:1387350-Prymnesium_polylepis.1